MVPIGRTGITVGLIHGGTNTEDGRPATGEPSQGWFLADRRGFLEPGDYAPGRVVTVTGSLLGYQDGTVAGADYRFPAVAADELRLWDESVPRSSGIGSRTPRIGVGANVGSGGSGVGVSVGF
jgi:outer membrane lipoprotein